MAQQRDCSVIVTKIKCLIIASVISGFSTCGFAETVWGLEFQRSAADGLSARNRIFAIIAYLQSIQVK
jgi:hypothetical protein